MNKDLEKFKKMIELFRHRHRLNKLQDSWESTGFPRKATREMRAEFQDVIKSSRRFFPHYSKFINKSEETSYENPLFFREISDVIVSFEDFIKLEQDLEEKIEEKKTLLRS